MDAGEVAMYNRDIYYANSYKAAVAAINTTQKALAHPYIAGPLQMGGGLIEAFLGSAVTAGSGGALGIFGAAVFAHGLDQMQAGFHTTLSGQHQYTQTEQLLQRTGMSPQNAALADSFISFTTMGASTAFRRSGQAAALAPAQNPMSRFTLRQSRNQISLSTATQKPQLNTFHSYMYDLSYEGKTNARVLRGWAKSKGNKRISVNDGRPEVWGIMQDGKAQWRLKLKPGPSSNIGLSPESYLPRFDAKISTKGFFNPFTGEIGTRKTCSHHMLEKKYF